MKQRFVIKYCNILDTPVLIDTLKRMPLAMVIHKVCYIHGWVCNDQYHAERLQDYFEKICGFQKTLFQEVNSFTLTKSDWYGDWDITDNNGKIFRFTHKEDAIEFKEWLEKELEEFKK